MEIASNGRVLDMVHRGWHLQQLLYLRDPDVLAGLRHANAGVSLALYGMCGLVWYPRASLREMKRRAAERVA